MNVEPDGRDRAIRELLQSPLGPERSLDLRPWGVVLVGALVGAVFAAGVGALFARQAGSASSTAAPVPTGPTAVSTQAPPSVAIDATYPPEFRQVTDGAALAPLAIVEVGGRHFVSVASFVARGELEPATWFRGGRWELSVAGGGRVPMVGAVREQLLPGVFTVEFDVPSGSPPEALHLVERWDADVRQVAATLDLTDFPFVLEGPLTLELSDGVSLVVEALELGDTTGFARWRIDGAERLAGDLLLTVGIFDESGDAMQGYGPRGGLFRGFLPGDVGTFLAGGAAAGEVALFGASTRATTPVRAELSVTVPLLRTFPASLEMALAGVPVEQR